MRQSLLLVLVLVVAATVECYAPFAKFRTIKERPPPSRLEIIATAGDAPAALEYSQFFTYLEDAYSKSGNIKCPFFRRRAADLIDGLATMGRFLLVRHKSLDFLPPGCGEMVHCRSNKSIGFTTLQIMEIIQDDWKPSTAKGYYITGRLNTTIYRNDCLFSGPDPDMPVKGLRKYLGAASHLFDTRQSHADLLDLKVVDDDKIVARWQLEGVLMLPWRPVIPPWRGSTTYHLDEQGLVYHHEEQWDKSVLEAFVSTIFPEVGEKIFKKNDNDAE